MSPNQDQFNYWKLSNNQNQQQYLSIVDFLEVQVRQTPNNIAIVFGEQKLTYQELNTQANQLPSYLKNLGIKPEVLVGICLERSLLLRRRSKICL